MAHAEDETDKAKSLLRRFPRLWHLGRVLVETVRGFSNHDAVTLSAAIAFYAILSAGPLLVLLLAVADTMWGREAAMHQVMGELRVHIGESAAATLQGAVADSRIPGEISIAAAISAVVLLLSATLLFAQLRDAIATIWELPRGRNPIREFIKQRIVALVTILVIGLVLLLSTLVSSVASVMRAWFAKALPAFVTIGLDWLVSWVWFALLLFSLFRVLSGRTNTWRLCTIAACVAAMLLIFGKELIAWYLSTATVTSAYGAAGTLATIALWVYYSCMALFVAAEYAWASESLRKAPPVP